MQRTRFYVHSSLVVVVVFFSHVIGWKSAPVRLLTAIYDHNLTCSSVNILCHTSGSIVITLRTYRITFADLETQHSISFELWRETGNLWLWACIFNY